MLVHIMINVTINGNINGILMLVHTWILWLGMVKSLKFHKISIEIHPKTRPTKGHANDVTPFGGIPTKVKSHNGS